MAHTAGRDHEAVVFHLVIDPVYKTFHHTKEPINHPALHTADRI